MINTININNATVGKTLEAYGNYNVYSGHNYGLLYSTRDKLTTINASNCTYVGTDASNIFLNCSKLESAKLDGWKMPDVTSLGSMFSGCSSLTTLNLSSWDVSSVQSTASLFSGCSQITKLNIDGWKTTSLSNTTSMFQGCTGLTELDFSGWNTSNLTTMASMFSGCTNLTTLNLDNWDISKCSDLDMRYTLSGTNLHSLSIKNGTLASCFKSLYYDATPWSGSTFGLLCSVKDKIQGINAEGCTYVGNSMYRLFYQCTALTDLNVSNWTLPNVVDMNGVFCNCTSIENIDITTWDLSKVTNMAYMFASCNSLTSQSFGPKKPQSVTSTEQMFLNCEALTSLDLGGWNTSNLTTMASMFQGCTNLTTLNLDGWDISKCSDLNMRYTLSGTNLQSLSIKNGTLASCFKAQYYDATPWSGSTFGLLCTVANKIKNVDAEGCTYVGNSTYRLFVSCTALEEINLKDFSSPTLTDVTEMFSGCTALSRLDIRGWDLSGVTNFSKMFNGCTNVTITCYSDAATILQNNLSADNLNRVTFNIVARP